MGESLVTLDPVIARSIIGQFPFLVGAFRYSEGISATFSVRDGVTVNDRLAWRPEKFSGLAKVFCLRSTPKGWRGGCVILHVSYSDHIGYENVLDLLLKAPGTEYLLFLEEDVSHSLRGGGLSVHCRHWTLARGVQTDLKRHQKEAERMAAGLRHELDGGRTPQSEGAG